MGTHYQGSRKETVALDTFIKLVRASESVSARLAVIMAERGLTISQFGALEALYHLGPLCQRELGEKILKSGGNITMVVDNLERNGHVKRARDKKDRRYFRVRLTAKGRRLIAKAFPDVLGRIVKEVGVLTQKEQKEFAGFLLRVGLGKKH